jgi:hypothetical protein
VFVDETGASTKMTRLYGRCPRGERLVAPVPSGHWKTTTFLGALRQDGLVAPCAFDGPINGETFRAWVEQFLAPELKPGDIVILDNLPSHKVEGVRTAIENAGARLLSLPSYSRSQPDRAVVRQTQGPAAQSRSANLRRPHPGHRKRARNLHPRRMRKLSRKLRISPPIMKCFSRLLKKSPEKSLVFRLFA